MRDSRRPLRDQVLQKHEEILLRALGLGRTRLYAFPLWSAHAPQLGQDGVLHQQDIHRPVNAANFVEHKLVEQLQQDQPHFDVVLHLCAGLLVGVGNRLGREGVVVRLQAGVAEQHTHPLVQGGEFLFAVLAQSRRHGVELEGLVEIVLADQRQFDVGQIDIGEVVADLFRAVTAQLEFAQVADPELDFYFFPLREHLVPCFPVQRLGVHVADLALERRERVVRLVEHAGQCRGQTLAKQIATLRQNIVEGCYLRHCGH